jgi:malate dehydrogenase (oxaloacetate-decarboxylating)
VPSFNDDIQGTGAVALAGIFTAERTSGRRLADERVLILGGGAAGLGIARQIRVGMVEAGLRGEALANAIAVLDSKGLIVGGADIDAYKRELAWTPRQAAGFGLDADRSFARVVERYRPTVLIGTSGQAGAFTRAIVTTMASHVERPVILPLSNPTASCEADPQDLYAWTAGRALVATGSPFPDVGHAGRRYRIGQGNNVYIFPGVGLAVLGSGRSNVPDLAFTAAAAALAGEVTAAEIDSGLLYPPIARLRAVSHAVARAVMRALAAADGSTLDEREATRIVESLSWEPEYVPYEPE